MNSTIKYLLLLAVSFMISRAYAQKKDLAFVTKIHSDEELGPIYDSLKTPLLVYNDNVYQMNSGCLINAFGGDYNDRNAGGTANDRNSAGNANDRSSGGGSAERSEEGDYNSRHSGGKSNKRNAGGDANDRNAGGIANDRNAGGNANDRNAGGNVNDRNAGGAAMSYTCEVDNKGKLTIYFKELKKNETLRIYYNHLFYTNQYFKIKKI
jgi:hypothetical protein